MTLNAKNTENFPYIHYRTLFPHIELELKNVVPVLYFEIYGIIITRNEHPIRRVEN